MPRQVVFAACDPSKNHQSTQAMNHRFRVLPHLCQKLIVAYAVKGFGKIDLGDCLSAAIFDV